MSKTGSLNKRIQRLESFIPPEGESSTSSKAPDPGIIVSSGSFVDKVDHLKVQTINTQYAEVINDYKEQVSVKNASKSLSALISFTVTFVEEFAPKISKILGYAITKQLKMDLLIELVLSVGTSVSHGIDLIKDFAEHTLSLTINKDKKEVVIKQTEKSKGKKKINFCR